MGDIKGQERTRQGVTCGGRREKNKTFIGHKKKVLRGNSTDTNSFQAWRKDSLNHKEQNEKQNTCEGESVQQMGGLYCIYRSSLHPSDLHLNILVILAEDAQKEVEIMPLSFFNGLVKESNSSLFQPVFSHTSYLWCKWSLRDSLFSVNFFGNLGGCLPKIIGPKRRSIQLRSLQKREFFFKIYSGCDIYCSYLFSPTCNKKVNLKQTSDL